MLTDNAVFDAFVARMGDLIDRSGGREAEILRPGQKLLADLVSDDSWLPADVAEPHPDHFKQYMLYSEPRKRFSVLSVVWAPGQSATAHNHTVWGLIGQLRGAEVTREYDDPEPGRPLRVRSETVLRPGETTAVSPEVGDIHDVANAVEGISVSIHVYGGDLASLADRRNRYDPSTGTVTPFIASYY